MTKQQQPERCGFCGAHGPTARAIVVHIGDERQHEAVTVRTFLLAACQSCSDDQRHTEARATWKMLTDAQRLGLHLWFGIGHILKKIRSTEPKGPSDVE